MKPAPSDSWNVRCRPLKRPKPRGRHNPSGSEIRNLASGFQISSFLDFVFYKGRGLLAHWTTCQGPQSQVKPVRGRGKGCGLMDPLDHTPIPGPNCMPLARGQNLSLRARARAQTKKWNFPGCGLLAIRPHPLKKQRNFVILLAIRPHPPIFSFFGVHGRAPKN